MNATLPVLTLVFVLALCGHRGAAAAEPGTLATKQTPAQTTLPSPPQVPLTTTPFLQPDSTPPKALAVTEEELRAAIIPIPHVAFVPDIYAAVLANDDTLVRQLISAGLPAHCVTPEGDTPLCLALRHGRADLAIYLLLHGADPNARGLGGHPPIALASLRRHPQLLRIMLAAGADPNQRFGYPFTKSFLSMVSDEYLRDEMKHERNLTPLMACAARGDVEGVTLLLQWGADKQAHTLPHYRYAINFAADQRYLYVMRLLLGRNPESEPHILITVDLSQQKAWLDVEGQTILKTTISTGRRGYGTPPGRYVITNKYKHWVSTLYDVPMPYFMRLNCGAIGLHSGYVTGRPASHGCIRLPHEMAKKFFEMVSVGDEVTIQY